MEETLYEKERRAVYVKAGKGKPKRGTGNCFPPNGKTGRKSKNVTSGNTHV